MERRFLYWITELNQLDQLTAAPHQDLSRSTFIVFCKGTGQMQPGPEANYAEMRKRVAAMGLQLFEMHGPCEQIIPSLARVLKVHSVVLGDAATCECRPEVLEEVRQRLNMHSIEFERNPDQHQQAFSLVTLPLVPAIAWLSQPVWNHQPPVF